MSEEIVDGFAWTPELRARVYPSRKVPNRQFLDGVLERVSLTYPIDAKAAGVLRPGGEASAGALGVGKAVAAATTARKRSGRLA